MMSRIALVSTIVLLAVSCSEFSGRKGVLGFNSSASLGESAWTPEHRMASGAPIHFMAVEDLKGDREVEPAPFTVRVWGASGWTSEDGILILDGEPGERALVRFSDGRLEDDFLVRFSRPDSARLFDPVSRKLGIDLGDVFAVVEGADVELDAEVLDRKGQALGYAPDALSLVASGPVSAWGEDSGDVHVSGDSGGPGEIVVSYAGEPLGAVAVDVVSADEIDEIELRILPLDEVEDDLFAAVVIAWSDGRPVLGVPAEFDWEGGDEVKVEEAGPALLFEIPDAEVVHVRARVGSLMVEDDVSR